MIDNSRVTKDDANGLEPAAPRILARQLARPLTDDEVNHVAGGMMSRVEAGGVSSSSLVMLPLHTRSAPGTTPTSDYSLPTDLLRRSAGMPLRGPGVTPVVSCRDQDSREKIRPLWYPKAKSDSSQS